MVVGGGAAGAVTRGRLASVVSGAHPPGVYRWRSRAHPAALARELGAAGWDLYYLDGSAIRDEAGLFATCAAALRFPSRFRPTWDSLADCLGDLSWLPLRGRVVVWDRDQLLARSSCAVWSAALGVFDTAFGRSAHTPTFLLLRGAPLPELTYSQPRELT